MAITNGYCTLNELKHALELAALTYTGTTLAFVNSPPQITDTASGLQRFGNPARSVVRVSGSIFNSRDFTITAVTPTALTVTPFPADAIAGPSVTLTDVSDLDDDGRLEAIVTAVSRAIDGVCRRRFYADTETRYFAGQSPDVCLVDDLLSVSTLKTDDDGDRTYDETWATTDYDLLPANAALDGEPYRRIETTPNSSKRFPRHAKSIEIAGSWGYVASTPPAIREACILWSARIFERRHAIFGIKGSTPQGEVYLKLPPPDPDVKALLRPYLKVGV